MNLLQLFRSEGYPLYVLCVLLAAFLLDKLDRYLLATTSAPMAQDIHFGDMGCLDNITVMFLGNITCKKVKSEDSCTRLTNPNGTQYCLWDYNGSGVQYQILVGPAFTVVFSITGVILGFIADIWNRKYILVMCLMFWSGVTILTGFAQEYWHVVLLRFALGMGEAGCTPFAASIIADYFSEEMRGSAMGFFNWGIYIAYSLSFAIGNYVTKANINGQGWRWAYFISGIPGFPLGLLILLTVKEPERRETAKEIKDSKNHDPSPLRRLMTILRSILNPSLMMLIIAGSVRNAAGYIWSNNTQLFFDYYYKDSQVGLWMSWVPLFSGCFGVLFGGFISDRVVKRVGPQGRIWVLVLSQLCAAPFATMALYLEPPYAFLALIPCYIIGEMWVGVTLAVVVELVPSYIRTSIVAVYLFISTNIGGNSPLLVPPLKRATSLRTALTILFPGLYVAGSLLFVLTLLVLRRDLKKVQQEEEERQLLVNEGEGPEDSGKSYKAQR
ncbi:SPNS2 [Branchiostoma lanceolatum]|uniref:SPNS2 protein n=1 Tax=Branchiostoma lanceolatum TaxID=7740 RepID=A0A8K0ACR7_BRALA|nr:SPNS2 [Branchiostoma lanceolatum]CAH1272333.1 SPNS2 [Branchiostoma lanceolatum]